MHAQYRMQLCGLISRVMCKRKSVYTHIRNKSYSIPKIISLQRNWKNILYVLCYLFSRTSRFPKYNSISMLLYIVLEVLISVNWIPPRTSTNLICIGTYILIKILIRRCENVILFAGPWALMFCIKKPILSTSNKLV